MDDPVRFLELMFAGIDTGYLNIFVRDDNEGESGLSPSKYSMFGALPLTGDARLSGLRQTIADINGKGYGVHFGVGVCAAPKDKFARATKADIVTIPCLWGDIDGVTLDEGLQRLEALEHYPTLVFHSGGGIHFYFALKQSLSITSGNMPLVERTLQGIAKTVGGDAQVGRVNNTMRLPFTINQKKKRNGHVVALVDTNPERYSYVELEVTYAPLIPPPPARVTRPMPAWASNAEIDPPGWVRAYLTTGRTENTRNQTLFSVARWYANAGIDQSQAEAELIPRAVGDGLKEREALRTIKSAYGYGGGQPQVSKTHHTYMAHADRILEIRRKRGK